MRSISILIVVFWASIASGTEFRSLGSASIFNNDYFGDGDDRWRTGSYSLSMFFGEEWHGELPASGVLEFRFRGEVIAPTDVSEPAMAGERPFVGMSGIGAARHFKLNRNNVRLGGELAFIGPQTGISSFVADAHEFLGFKLPDAAEDELPDNMIPTASFELSRMIKRTPKRPFELKPFISGQAGVETFARIGVDVFFGQGMMGDLTGRDVVTGHMMTVLSMQETTGFTPMFGADIAHVWDSSYLPSSTGLTVKRWRMRVRGGMRSIGAENDVFLGMTWLSPEYEGQPSGQVLGSISIDHRF